MHLLEISNSSFGILSCCSFINFDIQHYLPHNQKMERDMHTLIIVDDDELIRRGLEKVVPWEKHDFSVSGVFSSAADALAWIKENDADVILTDVKMPRMSGLDLIEEVKMLKPKTRSVIISGFNEFDFVKSALTLKVEDYLLKPLSIKDVEAVFSRISKDLTAEKQEEVPQNQLSEFFFLYKTLVSEFSIWKEYISDKKDKSGLCLIQYSGKNEKDILGIMNGLHYAVKPHSLSFIALEDEIDGIVSRIRELLESFPDEYKIVVGGEVFWDDDISVQYWKAFDRLSVAPPRSVVHIESKKDEVPGRIIEKGRAELVKVIGTVDDSSAVKVASMIIEEASALDKEERRYIYFAILNKLARYFAVIDDINIEVYPASSQSVEMDEAFIRDVLRVRELVALNKHSNAHLIAQKANNIIRENYMDPDLMLSSVSEKLGVSYGYLSAVFSEIIGESFKSYLIKVRMEEARKLLLSRHHKVYEIAEKVGYSSTKYFTEAFRRYYGVSPAEYIVKN